MILKNKSIGLTLVFLSTAYISFCQLPDSSADLPAEVRSLVAAGNLPKSEEELSRFVASHPASANAHFLLGYILFREKKALQSLGEFNAGARLRQPKSDELKTVASDYVLLGDYAKADKWFTEVTARSPNDPDAWYLLGRTKYSEDGFVEAVASFERALTLRPRYIEAANNIGLSWRELNDKEKAKAAFQNAIDWQGANPVDPQPFLNLGTLLVDEEDSKLAVPFLTKAAAISPDNPKIHEELGQAFEKQNNLSQAQTELEKAVKLAPNVSSLHFKLGRLYRRKGMSERAQEEFEFCRKLDSTQSSTSTPNPYLPN